MRKRKKVIRRKSSKKRRVVRKAKRIIKRRRKPVEKNGRGVSRTVTTMRLEDDLLSDLTRLATLQVRSRSNLVEVLLKKEVEKNRKLLDHDLFG